MELNANWICPQEDMGDVCPVFRRQWKNDKEKNIVKAELVLTALGVYEACLNGQRVSDYVLAPGWTVYEKRLQVQQYDITELIGEENCLTVTVGKGWMRSPMPGWFESEEKTARKNRPCGIIGEIRLWYADGSEEKIGTDTSWECGESPVRFSEIYDGETYDARLDSESAWHPVELLDWPKDILIWQEGEEIREMERVAAKSVFRTPKGELVVDFGQEVTGYVEFCVNAHEGDCIRIQHAEVLDADGNFYNANYRTAKAEINYICKEGEQTWHPHLTFFGFRYIRLAEFPTALEAKSSTESELDLGVGVGGLKAEQFTAISVYSAICRTGEIACGSEAINQLISNIFWSQKDNFLDVPTDCPQRDERLGWTGDAQVFVKAASYNYDVERFFTKWMHDVAADQRPDGSIGQVIPDYVPQGEPSAAWGDAAVICPWQIYQTYGNPQVLKDQFESMRGWVDYITNSTKDAGLWTGGTHFGDWLGLDAPSGSYKGATRDDFIATAFYAHSTKLLVKAGRAIGENVEEYEKLHRLIVDKFRETYIDYRTQTEHVLALQFHLTEEPQATADALAKMIREDGCSMRTGFVGTPYLLHVLTDYGYTELAYSLLLREEYPSWLYSVGKGATTIWEHWDGIMEDGSFWSTDMNSFNHYAYGSVADWIYEKAAGILPMEETPGFAKVRIAPHPDARMGWLAASIETRHGKVSSKWTCGEDRVRYEIITPVDAEIVIGAQLYQVKAGSYIYYSQM